MPSRDLPRILLWTAGALWLASWFLPVIDKYVGWQAFHAVFAPPYGDTRGWEHQTAQSMSALTNVVFVVVFAVLAAGRTIRPGLLIRIGVACFVVNLYWLVQLARDGTVGSLLVGYYAWLAAYALMIALGLSARRTSKKPTADTRA